MNRTLCKQLQDGSREARENAHVIKMEAKRIVRARMYAQVRPQYVSANLSTNHPDSGMSMKEHLAEKEARSK